MPSTLHIVVREYGLILNKGICNVEYRANALISHIANQTLIGDDFCESRFCDLKSAGRICLRARNVLAYMRFVPQTARAGQKVIDFLITQYWEDERKFAIRRNISERHAILPRLTTQI